VAKIGDLRLVPAFLLTEHRLKLVIRNMRRTEGIASGTGRRGMGRNLGRLGRPREERVSPRHRRPDAQNESGGRGEAGGDPPNRRSGSREGHGRRKFPVTQNLPNALEVGILRSTGHTTSKMIPRSGALGEIPVVIEEGDDVVAKGFTGEGGCHGC
jgi:hypothetical protein